jgi:hypothetical protein
MDILVLRKLKEKVADYNPKKIYPGLEESADVTLKKMNVMMKKIQSSLKTI